MARTRTVLFGALVAAWACGCGTIVNLKTGEPQFYGGVQQDVRWLQTPRPQPSGIGISNLGPLVLFVDLPLSFAADTLTVPVAIYEWHQGEGRAEEAEPAGGRGDGPAVPAAGQPGTGG
jgi:uncharacterized protein YceK